MNIPTRNSHLVNHSYITTARPSTIRLLSPQQQHGSPSPTVSYSA